MGLSGIRVFDDYSCSITSQITWINKYVSNLLLLTYPLCVEKHQVGLSGENLNIYMREHLGNIEWNEVASATDQPLTWFKVY